LGLGELNMQPGRVLAKGAVGLPTYFETGGNDAGDFAEPVPAAPEPTTLALFGSGLLGLVMVRRRKLGRTGSPLA
jgi:hypothetical protein